MIAPRILFRGTYRAVRIAANQGNRAPLSRLESALLDGKQPRDFRMMAVSGYVAERSADRLALPLPVRKMLRKGL